MPSSAKSNNTKNFLYLVVFLVILVITFVSENNKPAAPGKLDPTATQASQAKDTPSSANMPGWLVVYFTDPNPPDQLDSGIDRMVQPFIDKAQTSIDVTSFDLNLPSLVNALSAAAKRGVTVRVVYDGENGSQDLNNDATGNKDFNAIKVLKASGVKVVDGGRSNGLMHNKMIIIDGQTLFMGSWNLSYNDTFRNNNNLLKITAPELIANYQAKFNELFVDKRFGTKAEVQAQQPSLNLDGIQVENYFSPPDKVMDKLIGYVQGARKSIHFMIFTYTSQPLADAMISQAKAGLDVQGVIENRGASQGALVPLYCAKLPVKVDGNKYTMHDKVIIIDGKTVVTGSFNFTKSADTANDDNILVIHSPAVAALYEQEYQRIDGAGNPPAAGEIKCP